MKKDKKDWKIRIIKSDLPELKERVNFLTGNAWDISIGIDGVEGIGNEDGRMVVNKIPKEGCAEAVVEWLDKRIRTRQEVGRALKEEIIHIDFVRGLVKRQLEDLRAKEDNKK